LCFTKKEKLQVKQQLLVAERNWLHRQSADPAHVVHWLVPQITFTFHYVVDAHIIVAHCPFVGHATIPQLMSICVLFVFFNGQHIQKLVILSGIGHCSKDLLLAISFAITGTTPIATRQLTVVRIVARNVQALL
jgi:hypothetical protein